MAAFMGKGMLGNMACMFSGVAVPVAVVSGTGWVGRLMVVVLGSGECAAGATVSGDAAAATID